MSNSDIKFETGGVVEINAKDHENALIAKKLIFVTPTHTIHLDISYDQEFYKPGDTVTLTIKSTDAETNEDVDCYVNLAVVDSSVYNNVRKGRMPPSLPTQLLLEKEVESVHNEFLYSEEYIDYLFDT